MTRLSARSWVWQRCRIAFAYRHSHAKQRRARQFFTMDGANWDGFGESEVLTAGPAGPPYPQTLCALCGLGVEHLGHPDGPEKTKLVRPPSGGERGASRGSSGRGRSLLRGETKRTLSTERPLEIRSRLEAGSPWRDRLTADRSSPSGTCRTPARRRGLR